MIKSQKILKIDEVIGALKQLREDDALPKNIRLQIDAMTAVLNDDSEVSAKIGKCLHLLDTVSEDLNIPVFIKPKIWEVASMLEKLNN